MMKLEIRRLSLRLEQFTLKIDVDLQNERTGIFGPSGAGKTSLLESIAGLRMLQTAEIRFDNQLFDDTARDSFDHVLSFLEIGPLLDRDVRSLSRGENQRIVIARALLSAPRLLLLDEPLTALDAKLKNAILEQLRSLHDEFGIPMMYVTHDPGEIPADFWLRTANLLSGNFALPRDGAGHCRNQIDLHDIERHLINTWLQPGAMAESFRNIWGAHTHRSEDRC